MQNNCLTIFNCRNNSYGSWLAAPREKKYFEGERVLCRQVLGSHLYCCYINEDIIIDQSIFIAKLKDEFTSFYSTKYLVSLIASKLYSFYFRHKSNEFDALFPKIKIGEFGDLPICKIAIDKQIFFIQKADIMLDLNTQLQEKKNKFQSRIKSNFAIENISTKLESFYEHDFKTFVAELKKQKVSPTLKQQDEWEEYFNSYKKEINDLQAEIRKTDAEIDQMVYKLYELTDEEIRIVEGSV